MPFAEANGQPVSRGSITLPRLGVWHADLQVLAQAKLADRVTLKVNGKVVAQGTVFRAALYRDTVPMRIVGGAGGYATVLKARHYRSVPATTVLNDILSETGERLSATVLGSLLSKRLDHWVRAEGEAWSALADLLKALDISVWRVLADGTLWIGEETWPTVAAGSYQLLEEEPWSGEASLWTEEVPKVQPGQVLAGRRVSRVRFDFSAERVRSTIWFER